MDEQTLARLDAACAGAGVDALKGLYGGANTTKALAGTPDHARPQVVYTPQSIVDALAVLWPEGIALDPCSGPDSLVPAEVRYHVEGRQRGRKIVFEPRPGDLDGLSLPWTERTYANTPFNVLSDWMRHAAAQPSERVLLAPVRTHRTWWLDYADTCSGIVWLRPLAFEGHKQTFPAPLAILYHGERVDLLYEAFADLGRPGRW